MKVIKQLSPPIPLPEHVPISTSHRPKIKKGLIKSLFSCIGIGCQANSTSQSHSKSSSRKKTQTTQSYMDDYIKKYIYL